VEDRVTTTVRKWLLAYTVLASLLSTPALAGEWWVYHGGSGQCVSANALAIRAPAFRSPHDFEVFLRSERLWKDTSAFRTDPNDRSQITDVVINTTDGHSMLFYSSRKVCLARVAMFRSLGLVYDPNELR
jgi:hypothetical protein